MLPPSQTIMSASFSASASILGVIHAGVDDDALVNVGFALFPLFNGALVQVQVGVGFKALANLLGQIAVGHGMADGHHFFAHGLEDVAHLAGGLALPTPVLVAVTVTTGLLDLSMVVDGPMRREIGARRQDQRSLVHQLGVGNIAVGKDNLLLHYVFYQFESLLSMDGNPFGDTVFPARTGGAYSCLQCPESV